MQESVYRAAVSDLTPISSRGKAYGIFNMSYGVGFLVSGAMFGLLLSYKTAFSISASYVLLMQIPATVLLLSLRSGKQKK
jgi:MFS family permease